MTGPKTRPIVYRCKNKNGRLNEEQRPESNSRELQQETVKLDTDWSKDPAISTRAAILLWLSSISWCVYYLLTAVIV